MKLLCKYCGNSFERKQSQLFCNVKCSVTYNNKVRKRPIQNILKVKLCKRCNKPIKRNDWKNKKLLCDTCWEEIKEYNSKLDEQTIGELVGRYNGHSNRYAYIRERARRQHVKEGDKCEVCDYCIHVDICHIKAIGSFPLTAKIKEVNNKSNIKKLCKNHHWEFDKGILVL